MIPRASRACRFNRGTALAAALGFLLVLTGLPAGCSGASGPAGAPAGPPAAAGSPQRGDWIRYAATAEPSTLNFVRAQDRLATVLGFLISDTLVQYDSKLGIVPRLAASWEFSAEGRTVTFHLRPGALWHDGVEVTAGDALYTAGKIRDPASAAVSKYDQFSAIRRIEAPDSRTLVVTYDAPDIHALDCWAGTPLIARHLWEKEADFLGSPLGRAPVGCGPFRFVSWTPGEEIVLRASDDYWGGRPNIDRFVVKIIPQDSTRLAALKLGEIDLLSATPAQAADLERDPAALAEVVLSRTPALYVWYIGWNGEKAHPFFSDSRVRRAMTLALDRPGYLSSTAAGAWVPAASIFPPASWAHDPAIESLPFDPAQAGALLDEAGWRDTNGDGVRDRDGRPFSFTLLYPQTGQTNDQMAEYFQQNLRGVGVRMELQKMEFPLMLERTRGHRFDAFMSGFQFDPDPDPTDILHSDSIRTGSNAMSYSNPEVDRLCEAARATLDRAQRARIYHEIERIFVRDQPATCISHPVAILARNRRIRGFETSPIGFAQIAPGIAAWWVPAGEQLFPGNRNAAPGSPP